MIQNIVTTDRTITTEEDQSVNVEPVSGVLTILNSDGIVVRILSPHYWKHIEGGVDK